MLNRNGVAPQPVEVDDFSGGMTDNFIAGPSNKFQRGDNFYLTKVGNKAKLATRPSLRPYTTSRIPTNSRINHQFDIEEKLFQISNKKIFQSTTSTFSEITGPSGNSAFSAGDDKSLYAVTVWNKHAIVTSDAFASPIKLFNNGTNWIVHNLGLPIVNDTPITFSTVSGSGASYGFAFHYYYQYSNQGVTFEEIGPVLLKSAALGPISGSNAVTISNIPTLTNTATTNYDTSVIKIKIYRTQNGGLTYFYLGQINNGTSSYVSTTDDLTLSNSTTLYTNGVDFPISYPPPPSKLCHTVNDILCLGYCQDETSGQYIPNRARFSNRFSLWSCPREFYENFDEEIVGISSFNIFPIYFCKNKIYRIEGYYLPDGSGGVTKKLISSTAGCLSHNSIIKTDLGLFWAGNDGFYHTDGYQVTRVSDDLSVTYLSMLSTTNQKKRVYGFNYPTMKAVGWAMQESSVNTDNDMIFLCHLQAGISNNMPFTTWSGGDLRSNFKPTSVFYVAGNLYQSDTNGYLLKYDSSTFSDIKIDSSQPVANWINKAIIYDYRSCAFNFGSDSFIKWVPSIVVAADNLSSISLQVYSNNDNSGNLRPLGEISYRGNVAWGDYSVAWGDETLKWNYFPIVTAKRRFPSNGLRCFYKQLIFTNSYTTIQQTAQLGTATFNGASNTSTLDNISNAWPTDCLDYFISTSFDNHVNQYKILSRTSSTLTVEDLGNSLPTGSYSWKIQGYQRDEILKIISYTINYAMVAQDAEPFR